ncbi:MAG: 3-phosphoshikimate 1-carboxyvinyltransferase [Deinococcales bacterium]
MSTLPATVAVGPQGPVDGTIRVPGSKSLTNRALVIAALARGVSRLDGALVAEDSDVLIRALSKLGFRVDARGTRVDVHGLGGRVPAHAAELDLRLSGTSMRFLTALTALGHGRYRLDGNARMRERPIQDLLSALEALGVAARSEAGNGCPPVVVEGSGLAGGEVEVAGGRSSQYLSGLLMVTPYAAGPVTLRVTGELQSKPFVDLTLGLMRDFGVEIERDGYRRFRVPQTRYRARTLDVEGDAMAAGYFWAAAAVTGGRVRVANLGRGTRQGDARLAQVLQDMGCDVRWDDSGCEVRGPRQGRLKGGDFDLNDMPDQAQTLAAVALFASGPVAIRNVWNLRIKETDRLAALATELRRLGARVDEGEGDITIHPLTEAPEPAVTLDTYGDHRMAMALAVVGARLPGVAIRDPGCVAKTYPSFFDDFLALLAGRLS